MNTLKPNREETHLIYELPVIVRVPNETKTVEVRTVRVPIIEILWNPVNENTLTGWQKCILAQVSNALEDFEKNNPTVDVGYNGFERMYVIDAADYDMLCVWFSKHAVNV